MPAGLAPVSLSVVTRPVSLPSCWAQESRLDTSCSSITHSVPEERERIIRSTVNRTDSVKTQSSLKLIHEKMSLLANLQEKADQCRYLESQLDSLDDKMSCVAKSR